VTLIRDPADLDRARARGLRACYPKSTRILVGMATCGIASGAAEVHAALARAIRKTGLKAKLSATGCIGICQEEPLVDVLQPGRPRVTFHRMSPATAEELVSRLADGAAGGDRLGAPFGRIDSEEFVVDGTIHRYFDGALPEEIARIPAYRDIDFYRKQRRIALRNCGFLDPGRIEEFIARGGYRAAARCLAEMTPEQVVREIERSGLRGRGGAGYPTGAKWRACREAPGDIRYVIANGDEGDPGAYMDRSILEGDPHSVIEGMIAGAYAVGAHEGYIYVRAEYPLAVESFTRALVQAEACGLLGDDILGTGFSFRIHVSTGGGAFVCGESTALMASIEGRIGEPRAKHVHATEEGLWDRPTVLNNVETWAVVPVIICRGADWYAAIGTERSRGTKVFSLVGKVKNTGLVEVPMGISLREIIYDIGGGIAGGRKLKAVQTGGPSGGCIPEEHIDLPVDYEKLAEVGSMMGSGGMIVMDDRTCMVDVARYFIDFLIDESCGKCTPCREGLQQMHRLLADITEGRGTPEGLALLEELAGVVRDTSLCGLGTSAPNPVLTTLRAFRAEYEAHVLEKRCPAGVCKALIRYSIDAEKCTGCMLCIKTCPASAISGARKKAHTIDAEACIACGACVETCRFDAVQVS
jgi:NADH:ubiquinone oxidoreductase subunit F (NADH-binding)/Pyruvate/2-oxoacid:ferredoxin oxidoreductase delta subunit/(2Fe-2S) ferredoxin